MGCYLGEGIYRTGDCSAVIVSNGHPNEEKVAFPGDRAITVVMLKTVSGCDSVGGGTNILYYWNGTNWAESSRHNPYTYSGYCQVIWTWPGAAGNLWWKITWDGCEKVFKTGSPTGFPCTFRNDLRMYAYDDKTSQAILTFWWKMTFQADHNKTYDAISGNTGNAKISSLCIGIYDTTVSAVGYISAASTVEVLMGSDLSIRLTPSTVPPPPDVVTPVINKLIEQEGAYLAPTKAKVDEIQSDTEKILTNQGYASSTLTTIHDQITSKIPTKLDGLKSDTATVATAISESRTETKKGFGDILASIGNIKIPDPSKFIIDSVNGLLQPARDVLTWTKNFKWPDWNAAIVQPVVTAADVWFSNRLGIDPKKPFWDEIGLKLNAMAIGIVTAALNAVLPDPSFWQKKKGG